jgi:hypothetical protein
MSLFDTDKNEMASKTRVKERREERRTIKDSKER